jgi:hypothetical protein
MVSTFNSKKNVRTNDLTFFVVERSEISNFLREDLDAMKARNDSF